MNRYTRVGRRFPLPSTLQIKHELRVRMAAEKRSELEHRLEGLRAEPTEFSPALQPAS